MKNTTPIVIFLVLFISCTEPKPEPKPKKDAFEIARGEFNEASSNFNRCIDSGYKYLPTNNEKAHLYKDSANYFLGMEDASKSIIMKL